MFEYIDGERVEKFTKGLSMVEDTLQEIGVEGIDPEEDVEAFLESPLNAGISEALDPDREYKKDLIRKDMIADAEAVRL